MKIISTESALNQALSKIRMSKSIAVDTETTGLYPHHGDRLFGISIATETEEYYLNFNIGGLKRGLIEKFGEVLRGMKHVFFVNYIYDLTILGVDKITVGGAKIIDAGVLARVEFSGHKPPKNFFTLDYLARFYCNRLKDTSVEKYIKENDLYKIDAMGDKAPDYSRVPLDIMGNYACIDARLTYDIVIEISRRIAQKTEQYKFTTRPEWETLEDKMREEISLSKCLFEINNRGLRLDVDFVKRAKEYETGKYKKLLDDIRTEVDVNINSPKQLSTFIRDKLRLTLPKRIVKGVWTGNYSTDADTLEDLAEKHSRPMLAKIVQAKRASKKVNTYYKNMLRLVGADDIIHVGLGQETTVTGRLSSFQPNFQNLHKESYHEYALRNCVIAREGFDLYFLDFKQQEMVIMVDLASELEIIKRMKEDGLDYYDATTQTAMEIMGLELIRKQSKALSLGIAYGQGKDLIASNLGTTATKAAEFKAKFKRALPQVTKVDEWLKHFAKINGRVHNIYGRCTHIDKGFEYKSLNALIQGTAADCTKRAVVKCHRQLRDYESAIILQVHDEIVFEIKRGEERLLPKLAKLMSKAYPQKHIALGVDAEHSTTSWAAKESCTIQ